MWLTPFIDRSFRPTVVWWFRFCFDIGAHRVGTSSLSVSNIREHITPSPLSMVRVCRPFKVCLFGHSGICFGAYGPSIKSVSPTSVRSVISVTYQLVRNVTASVFCLNSFFRQGSSNVLICTDFASTSVTLESLRSPSRSGDLGMSHQGRVKGGLPLVL